VATASCSVEGQVCPFLVPCATFAANASCVCSGGHFVCAGFDDAGIACPALSTTEKCPLNETAASGLFCSDLGLICTYPSACSSIPDYDSCQCIGGPTADAGPHFECMQACDLTGDATAPIFADGGTPDANAADAPTGGGAVDAGPVDAGSSGDGASGP
jgi:hypothetical protein